jgi:hypothetical protein
MIRLVASSGRSGPRARAGPAAAGGQIQGDPHDQAGLAAQNRQDGAAPWRSAPASMINNLYHIGPLPSSWSPSVISVPLRHRVAPVADRAAPSMIAVDFPFPAGKINRDHGNPGAVGRACRPRRPYAGCENAFPVSEVVDSVT